MDILFFGTSAGAPTKSRNVTAVAVIESTGKSWHLVDCGEGTQHQVLHSRLSLNSLSTIFITHLHGDHCYGLPGLLASAALGGRTKPLTIIAPEGIQTWIELTQQVSESYLPYELEFVTPNNVGSCSFNQFAVTSVSLSHRIASFGFVFTETNIQPSLSVDKIKSSGIPEGPLWGSIHDGCDIEFEGVVYKSTDFCHAPRQPRKIIICGDNDQPELLKNVCDGCDVLVHESTFANDLSERAKSTGHSYAQLIASFAQSVSISNLILTHVSARYTNSIHVLENEARQAFSGNLFIARDFDRYTLSIDGALDLSSTR